MLDWPSKQQRSRLVADWPDSEEEENQPQLRAGGRFAESERRGRRGAGGEGGAGEGGGGNALKKTKAKTGRGG